MDVVWCVVAIAKRKVDMNNDSVVTAINRSVDWSVGRLVDVFVDVFL